MRNKKILFDARLGIEGFSGISYVSREILNSLIEVFEAENIYLYTNALINDCVISIDNQIITKKKPFSFNDYSFYPKTIDFDLIFCPYTLPLFVKSTQNLVFLIHDVCFLSDKFWPQNNLLSFLKKNILKYHIKFISKNAFDIIVPTDIVQFYLKKKLNISSTIINNPVNVNSFIKIESFSNEKYILYVGNNRSHKNLNLLSSIIRSNQEYKFIFIGVNKIEFEKDFGFFENIQFKKKLEYNVYLNYIYHAEILINTSYCEGFCIPVYEALQLNTKVICGNTPIFKSLRKYLYLAELNLESFDMLIKQVYSGNCKELFKYNYINNLSYTSYFSQLNQSLNNMSL